MQRLGEIRHLNIHKCLRILWPSILLFYSILAAEPVRIITMSQSQVANPAAGPRKDLSRKPRPTAYSPDMDKPRVYSLARMREIDDWKNELFFTYRSFSYNGVGMYHFMVAPRLPSVVIAN